MSAAYYLALKGYDVRIIEQQPWPVACFCWAYPAIGCPEK